MLKRVLDLLFYVEGNKRLYNTKLKYVMFKKFGSVLSSSIAFYLVLLSYNLQGKDLYGYTALGVLFFIVIVYHSITEQILNRNWFRYIVIILIAVSAWSATGYYYIEGYIYSNKKELKKFDEVKYNNLKNTLASGITKIEKEYQKKIDDLKNSVSKTKENMLKLRESDKRSYYTIYIEYIKNRGDSNLIPNIKKNIKKEDLSIIMDKLARLYTDLKISELEYQRDKDIEKYKNLHSLDYRELELLSPSNVININRKIELDNKKLEDNNRFRKFLFAIGFFFLGLFLEVIVFDNGWVKLKDDKDIAVEIRQTNISEVADISKDFYTFMDALNVNKANRKIALLYVFTKYLINQARYINVQDKKYFKVQDLEVVINPLTKKPFNLKNGIKTLRDIFEELEINYYNINIDLLKNAYSILESIAIK